MEKFRQIMIFLRYVGLIYANKARLSKADQSQLLKDYLKLKLFNISPRFFKKNINQISFFNHKLTYFDINTTISLIESIFIENEYFFKAKRRKPKIFDLGSNIGLSLIYFKVLYPDSEIEAFEPDPITYEVLKRNVENFNLQGVKIFNFAITNNNGVVDFYVDKVGIGSPLMSVNPLRISNKKKIRISSIKLSERVKSSVDFLKMDIEGSESEVLMDLDTSKTMSLFDQISIEYHHHIDNNLDQLSDFLKILEKNNFGYQVHAKQNSPFELRVFEDIQIHSYKKPTR